MEKEHHWLLNPNMLLLKLIMTLVFGSASCLIPYLTIHMQSIGLTVEEIATIYLVMLFTTFMAPSLTGFLVDKFGKYKPVLITYLIINLLSHHALNILPKRDYSHHLPDTLAIKETTDGGWELMWAPCNSQNCKSESHVREYANHCLAHSLPESDTFGGGSWRESPVYSPINDGASELELSCRVKLSNGNGGSMKDCLMNCKYGNETQICADIPRTTMDTTFWLYMFIRFVATVIFQGSLTMVDAAAFNMIERYGGDFGKEKLFSSLGMAISTPLAGLMIDYFSLGLDYTNYDPAFYTYDVLLIVSVFAIYAMPLGDKPPAQNIGKNLRRILTMPHVVIFLVFLFIAGNFWGFIENYLFVIMKEMGSPNYLLGLTYTVGTITSIPMLYCSEKLTSVFGFINLLVIAFFAHGGRILSYAYME
jgi:predicted MFS family arabinose efflux permease